MTSKLPAIRPSLPYCHDILFDCRRGDGVYRAEIVKDDVVWTKVCGPLYVLAQFCDGREERWGFVVGIEMPNGRYKTTTFFNEELSAINYRQAISRLLRGGLVIEDPGRSKHRSRTG